MRFAFACFLVSLSSVEAYQGPVHNSMRALAMGNAYTALAVDKEAVYYNPAGLAMMNLVGNYDKRPDLGYLPQNFFDAYLTAGSLIDGPSLAEAFRMKNFYSNHKATFDSIQGNSSQAAHFLSQDTSLYNDFTQFDRMPLGLGLMYNMELAMPYFGGAIWANAKAQPYIDAGVIVPSLGIQSVEANVVGQMDGAFGLGNWNKDLFFGGGLKLVKNERISDMQIGIDNVQTFQDTIQGRMQEAIKQAMSTDLGLAVDMGMMYQWTREVRLGASLTNMFMGKLNDSTVTPNLTLGAAYSPIQLQRNSNYSRAVNFALDFSDILNSDRGYKPLSKINFGAEVEQTVLAIPYVSWASDMRMLKVRMSGGFKGGYWTAGAGVELFRILNIDAATWADEKGYVTGQNEDRSYAITVGIGI